MPRIHACGVRADCRPVAAIEDAAILFAQQRPVRSKMASARVIAFGGLIGLEYRRDGCSLFAAWDWPGHRLVRKGAPRPDRRQ